MEVLIGIIGDVFEIVENVLVSNKGEHWEGIFSMVEMKLLVCELEVVYVVDEVLVIVEN